MAVKDNISNIEGLENNTILKTLQNIIKYVKENAVKGDKGDTGSVGPAGPEGKSIVDIQNITSSVVGENTINTVRVMYNTGETEDFTISCKNGVNGSTGPAGPTGNTGVGIASIENKGYTDGTDFTITHIEVTLTNGETETFDVQAQRGATGPVGPAGEPADIQSVTLQSGTQGTIATEDLATLQTSNSNYIILDNEIYLLMDKQLASGYLVYSHIGQDSTNNYFVKCITITISTQAWVMTSTQLGGGMDTLTCSTGALHEKLGNLISQGKKPVYIDINGGTISVTRKQYNLSTNTWQDLSNESGAIPSQHRLWVTGLTNVSVGQCICSGRNCVFNVFTYSGGIRYNGNSLYGNGTTLTNYYYDGQPGTAVIHYE